MAELKMDRAINIKPEEVKSEGADNVTVRWLISEDDKAPNFAMRLFEIGPGGSSPFHTHTWEHEVYILEGEGKLLFEDKEKLFSGGYFIFVPGGKKHSFLNTGDKVLKFLCIVPNK